MDFFSRFSIRITCSQHVSSAEGQLKIKQPGLFKQWISEALAKKRANSFTKKIGETRKKRSTERIY
jgi:hypothetical protein